MEGKKPRCKKISWQTKKRTMNLLKRKFGKEHLKRIIDGVDWVATYWEPQDGPEEAFTKFCLEHFMTSEAEREDFMEVATKKLEEILGSGFETFRLMFRPIHVDTGEPVKKVDKLFASINIFSALTEMLFECKIAFKILLNYKAVMSEELLELEKKGELTYKDFCEIRLTDAVRNRVPGHMEQRIINAALECEDYTNGYHIHIHRILDANGQPYFDPDKPERCISHWELRDKIKDLYGQPNGKRRQKALYQVMRYLISQTIPKAVIDNPNVYWHLSQNKVTSVADGSKISNEPEPETRYQHLWRMFRAEKATDEHYGRTFIERSFLDGCEITENAVRAMIKTILTSPSADLVADIIRKRLGRSLESYDIWYQFVEYDAKKLDALTRARYPNIDAFSADIPNILKKLTFDPAKADAIAPQIKVELARSGGHAWGAMRHHDKILMRTRCAPEGMTFKDFKVSMHELGHCVEMTMSLRSTDNIFMADIANIGFSEAFAFLFERSSLGLLDALGHTELENALMMLDRFWDTFQICGVALLDIRIWNWLYPYFVLPTEQLDDGVRRIAREVWNEYFAPIIDVKDEDLLAIYSHIIAYPLYLSNYVIGEIASYQILDYCRDKHWPTQMERMCREGYVTPNTWMKWAVGSPLSSEPMFRLTQEALETVLNNQHIRADEKPADKADKKK